MRNRILPSFVIALTALIVTTMNLPAQPIAPKLVVPKCAKPPVMDGNIEKAEWQCTAAITGFVLFGGGSKLDPRQVIAYITYDDTNLYLAFELPIYPKGAKLLANLSTRDVGGWRGDDIVEILLDPFAGKHRNEDSYFQFMGNSKGAILFDQAETPGLGLYNRLEWNGRWTFRNKVLPDRWHAELSIPLKDLGINGIKDGAKWLAHFSRTWGAKVDWTTLSPTANALNVPGNGAELIFQSQAPAARLLSVGPLLNGRFGASGEVINGGDAERQITIEAWATSDDKQIAAKTLQGRLNPGEVHSFSFEETADTRGAKRFSPTYHESWRD